MSVPGRRPKVTLDIRPLLEAQWTGIPVFTRRLAQSLMRHADIDAEFMLDLARVPNDAVEAAIRAGTGVFLRDKIDTELATTMVPVDRHGCLLYPSAKDSFGVAAREASTVHDLSTVLTPEFHEEANIAYHTDRLTLELATNERIFCVSDATQAALITVYPSMAPTIRTLYQYVDWPDHFDLIERNLSPLRLGRYAVVIGTVEPRKNLGLLLRALLRPEIRRSPLRFVVIGRKGWKVDEFMAALPEEAKERVLFSGFVSEFTKYRLIKGSEFMVYPTMYEGFGIPGLEAMSLGKPVLASRTSSIPEVVGGAGVYFDPLSVDEFAEGLAEIAHPAKLAELAACALAESRAFNWQRMAAPIVEWAKER